MGNGNSSATRWALIGMAWGRAALLHDPAIERAYRAWNTQEYELIQSEGNELFAEYWEKKMRYRRNQKSTAPILRAQSKPLSHYLDWWRTNNPHMTDAVVTASA